MFLKEKSVTPLPIQDHMSHIQAHQEFLASPWALNLPPQGKRMAEMHLEETISLAYMAQKEAEAKALITQPAQLEGANVGQAGMEGMATSPAYLRSINSIGGKA